MATWIVKLLGQFQLKDAADTMQPLHNQDAVRLLAYLLYFHQRSHSYNQVVEVLWPHLDTIKRRNVFQTSQRQYSAFIHIFSQELECSVSAVASELAQRFNLYQPTVNFS
ncbi:transcriptional activator family -like protein [Leptolyngbya sp. Heron Island J]|nr:transcriptional activator family -like protein [Leptolyngbya sp. Heron Island J]